MAVQPPPIAAPVIDPISKKITEIWLGFFRSLSATATTPTIGAGSIGTTELAAGAVTASKLASQLRTVTGSRGSPVNITAAGGIAPVGKWDEIIFVQGSGGAIDITANPQIAVGTAVGQTLTLIGRGNTLKLDDGTGLSQNGSITLDADDAIAYVWDGTNWNELWRKDAT